MSLQFLNSLSTHSKSIHSLWRSLCSYQLHSLPRSDRRFFTTHFSHPTLHFSWQPHHPCASDAHAHAHPRGPPIYQSHLHPPSFAISKCSTYQVLRFYHVDTIYAPKNMTM